MKSWKKHFSDHIYVIQKEEQSLEAATAGIL